MDRRRFLLFAAATGVATACGTGNGNESGPAVPVGEQRFANRLSIPPVAEPTVDPDGAKRFALTMQAGRTEILAGKQTATRGFNGAFLGPTVRASRGDTVRMSVTNRLDEVSTVHWHGMQLPARMDGGPHQPIEPGATWEPYWTIEQPAATSWYHPHPHGSTARHVYQGLAGMFLIDDPAGPPLPSTYGVDDIPLILQDKEFDAQGAFAGDTLDGTFGILGDHILVNGTVDPFLEIGTERVRLRILNGSNAASTTSGSVTDGRSTSSAPTSACCAPRWRSPRWRSPPVNGWRSSPGSRRANRSSSGPPVARATSTRATSSS